MHHPSPTDCSSTPRYPTAWAGPLTFDELYADLKPYAYGTLRPTCRLYEPEPLHEAVQNGFIALYTTLLDDPTFLAARSRRNAVYFMAARCGSSSLKRRISLEEAQASLDDRWPSSSTPDASSDRNAMRSERWAAFATRVDFQVDFERVIQRLADRYAASVPHLIALYGCTTQITYQQAESLLQNYRGGGWRGFQQLYTQVQREVRAALAEVFRQQPSGTLLDQPLKLLRQTDAQPAPRSATPLSALERTTYTQLARLYEAQGQPVTARALVQALGSVSINAVRESLGRLAQRGVVHKQPGPNRSWHWTPVPEAAAALLAAATPRPLPRLGERHTRVYHALCALDPTARACIPVAALQTALSGYSRYSLRRALCDLEAHGLARRMGYGSATQGWSALHPSSLPLPSDSPDAAQPRAA